MKQISLGYQSELAWDVASSIFHVIAIGVCFLRIFIRLKRGMLWWDDRIIALGALYNFVTISTLWAKPPFFLAGGVLYLRMAWTFVSCYIIMWLSRIAMWLSLARIYPQGHRARFTSFFFAALCMLLAISTVLLATFGCKDSGGGTRQLVDKCYGNGRKRTNYQNITMSISVVEITMDIVLVAVPTYFLSDIKLPRSEKVLVTFLGSGNFLTLLALGVNCLIVYGPFLPGTDKAVVAIGSAHLAAYIALMSASAPVVGTFIYSRVTGRISQWSEEGSETSRGSRFTSPQSPVSTRRLPFSFMATADGASEVSTVTYASGFTPDSTRGRGAYDIESGLYMEQPGS